MNPDRIDVYTDPNLGDFHKMIAPGTYDIRLSANGYAPKTVNNVTVPDTGSVLIGDVLLAPDSTYLYAFKSVLCRYRNHAEQSNKTRPRAALGPQDGLFFSLGQNGFVVLDMGTDTPIHNSAGDDFTVYEGDDGTNEGYEVLASDDWYGPWFSCGTATGTASFDLSTAGLSEARYISINDDGSSSSGQYAGFDLDVIKFFATTGIKEGQIAHYQSHIPNLSILPNPFREITNLKFQFGRGDIQMQDARSKKQDFTLKIYDVSGRVIRSFDLSSPASLRETGRAGLLPLASTISWDGTDQNDRMVPAGVYFVRFVVNPVGEAGDYQKTEKAVLLR